MFFGSEMKAWGESGVSFILSRVVMSGPTIDLLSNHIYQQMVQVVYFAVVWSSGRGCFCLGAGSVQSEAVHGNHYGCGSNWSV